MVKTPVYLPDDLKERLAQAARISGESEASIIRRALEQWLAGLLPRPRSCMVGAIPFDDLDLADKVDEVLAAGFG
jgi:hypothetical protein